MPLNIIKPNPEIMFARKPGVPFFALQKVFFVFLFFLIFGVLPAQENLPMMVGRWPSMVTFSMSQSEEFMVLLNGRPGNYELVETRLNNGMWEQPVPIKVFDEMFSASGEVGGLALNYNNQLLFFHGKKSATNTGTDIFYMEKQKGEWQTPKKLAGPVNSGVDELSPTVSPGMDRIFFIRRIPEPDFKKPDDAPVCGKLFVSNKTADGSWSTPQELYQMINTGCLQSPSIGVDGKTLVYSSVDPDNHRYGYDLFFTREPLSDVWTEPQLIAPVSSKEFNLAPQVAGDHLYYVRQTVKRGEVANELMAINLPQELNPSRTVEVRGQITGLEDQQPVSARLEVSDATTLEKKGEYFSSDEDGSFEMPLLYGRNYLVDVRKKGYSFAGFMADLRQEESLEQPGIIELFQQVEVELSVFDNEIFRPLEAKVEIVDAADAGAVFDGRKESEGRYTFILPLGREYKVKATCDGFESGGFSFDLLGDVIFSEFKRNLALAPFKRDFEVFICDSETGEPVAAVLRIKNLDREEELLFRAENVREGLIKTRLRDEDRYEFTVDGVQGYSFYNEMVDLADNDMSRLRAELVSLKTAVAIRLKNILFSFNSATLSSGSFPELNRVIKLLGDNPEISVEIAAHTDNVGSADFNKLLSERRAESVVDYLLENGVSGNRLNAKGYGLTDPLVPNDSEENRALNRRVEFRILEDEGE